MVEFSGARAIIQPSALAGLGGVVALLLLSYLASFPLLNGRVASSKNRFIFVWLAYDALTHFIFEGSFLHTSLFGRTAATGSDWTATLWREYGKADLRWAHADAGIVSLELLTVFLGGPLCLVILYYLCAKKEVQRHFWTVVLCTMELYGGAMTFFPEWLTGSPNLVTSNWLYTYIYLALMNGLWVVIPFWLLYDSYVALTSGIASVRFSAVGSPSKKKRR